MTIKEVQGFGSRRGLTQFWRRKGGAHVSPQWDCDLWLIFLQISLDVQFLGHFPLGSANGDRAAQVHHLSRPPCNSATTIFGPTPLLGNEEQNLKGMDVLFKLETFLGELRSFHFFLLIFILWMFHGYTFHLPFMHWIHSAIIIICMKPYFMVLTEIRYDVLFGPVHKVKTCPGRHCAWSNHAVPLRSMVVPSTLETCEHTRLVSSLFIFSVYEIMKAWPFFVFNSLC